MTKTNIEMKEMLEKEFNEIKTELENGNDWLIPRYLEVRNMLVQIEDKIQGGK